MDWIAILDAGLVGAIAGGLAGLLGTLLGLLLPEKLRKPLKGAVVGIGIVCAIVATQLLDFSILSNNSSSGGLFGPGLTEEQFDNVLGRSKEPGAEMLRIVRQKDPAFYARVRDRIIALSRSGKSGDQLVNEVRATIAAEVAVRTPRLSDAELDQVLDILAFQFAHYKNVAPRVCVDLLLQRPAGDIRKYTTDEMMETEVKLYGIVFSSQLEGGPTLSTEELSAALEPVYAGIQENHGPDALEIMAGTVTSVEDHKTCSIFLAFFDGIRAMPMPRRVHVWRTLSQMGAAG